MAIASVLSAYAIAQSYNSKFIWAASSFCPAFLNQRGLIPAQTLEQLTALVIPHIREFQDTDPEKYAAPDLHSNDLCHRDYMHQVIKPKISELFK